MHLQETVVVDSRSGGYTQSKTKNLTMILVSESGCGLVREGDRNHARGRSSEAFSWRSRWGTWPFFNELS